MEIVTLEEMLESLRESIENELGSEGLATWTLNASGLNFADTLNSYPLVDLEDLRDEIVEGNKVEVTIDLSDAIVAYLDELIERLSDSDDEEDYDDNEEDYDDEDYDDDDEPEE